MVCAKRDRNPSIVAGIVGTRQVCVAAVPADLLPKSPKSNVAAVSKSLPCKDTSLLLYHVSDLVI